MNGNFHPSRLSQQHNEHASEEWELGSKVVAGVSTTVKAGKNQQNFVSKHRSVSGSEGAFRFPDWVTAGVGHAMGRLLV